MKFLFLLVIWGVSSSSFGQEILDQESKGPVALPPCWQEANNVNLGGVLPDCDEFGFHTPRQCDADRTLCWCVSRCGDPLMHTKGGPDVVCEPDDPPCTKELAGFTGARMRLGQFKPHCHDNGFYHHRQCKGSVCWCTDRCGNKIPASNHNIVTRGVCECANDDFAWKCTTNPCDQETVTCPAHPDAVCKPSACGGCVAKFYVEDKEVDCALQDPVNLGVKRVCTNEAGVQHNDGESWPDRETKSVGKCSWCSCEGGEETCMTLECPPPPREDCTEKEPTGQDCCTQYDCPEPSCTDYNGNKHKSGERWKMDKCVQCECLSGEAVCMSPSCAGPPMGWRYCSIKAGMEDVCCPDFDCVGCLDSNGLDHYDVGETWDEAGNPCSHCTCTDNNDVSCVREVCPGVNRYIPPLCQWIIRTGECCPISDSSEGIVCNEPISACEPHSVVTQDCPSDLCLTATCDGHPDAQCKISHCGACHAVFYDSDGAKVACQNEVVVSGCDDFTGERHNEGEMWMEGCKECTCEATGIPACRAKTCDNATCEDGHRVGEVWEDSCMTCECSTYLTAVCIPHECGLAPPIPDLCHLAKQTPDECCPSKIVCEEAISLCREGTAVAPSCADDLCDTTCEGHPNATCLISRCGGCEARFFDENGERVLCGQGFIISDPVCPENLPPPDCLIVFCELNPCVNTPNAVCHLDYCQPCRIVYFDDLNRKINCSAERKDDEIDPVSQCYPDAYRTGPQGNPTFPRCLKNGQFAPKQCDTSGYCWCANPDGSMATKQRDVPVGKDLVCVSEPPCYRELLDNKHKTERGEVVTSDPVCSTTGWYEPAQCSPTTGECWCSERDGSVVIGSVKQQGEPVNCNEQCLGDVGNIVADVVCSKTYNGCPSNAFCHIPPNHTSGKCCYLPPRAMP